MRFLPVKTQGSFLVCLLIAVIVSGCSGDNQAANNTGSNSRQGVAEISDASQDTRTTESGQKWPRIVFETTSYDFGDQVSGVDLEKTFTFTNKGDGVLIVENVRAG